MCGIVGIVGTGAPESIGRMVNTIIHRGPDDVGFYADGKVLLGVCRLSIIDLSPLGHQPMSNEDDSLWIVYNGEIYNYRELNYDLRQRGHSIKSNSDTETILHVYEEYGEDCVSYLQGMFSFVIWDKKTQSLFAARDRLGIKPLYYSQIEGRFLFASELKALLASGLIPREVNPAAIQHYLSFGAVPAPMTIWKNVWALLPGHRLTYSKRRLKTEQYWDARTAVSESPSHISTEEAKREVRRLLEEAVRIRLMSDVPLGAFLSGGIDSSIVVGIMSQFSDRPVRTFSVGYDAGNDTFDERRYALLVAQHFHTDHQEVVVRSSDVLSALDKIIWHMDQPSHNALNSYVVSQAAASGVKVALSGLGGDEVFAGYSTFEFIRLLRHFHVVQKITPLVLKETVAKINGILSPRLRAQWPWRVGMGVVGAYSSLVDQFAVIRFFYEDGEKVGLLTPEFQRMLNDSSQIEPSLELLNQLAEAGHGKDIINQVSYLELKSYMPDVLLRDVDVMSMAHSLEVRVPLIDHRLVEFVLGLPGNLKARGFRDVKWLLKESVRDLLPPEILHRKKAGFAFPMSIWLHEPAFREVVEDCLSRQSVWKRGIFDWRTVEQVKKQFYEHRQFGNSGQIWLRVWILTVFELWCRTYLDGIDQTLKKRFLDE